MRQDGLLAKRPGDALAPWVVHDLGRSMATHMERIGIEPHVIEVCLGHVPEGVAGTYRQYAYLPEKAVTLQEWANELLSACAVKAAYGVTETMALLSLGRTSLYEFVKIGSLRATKCGRRTLFLAPDIAEFLSRLRQTGDQR